VGGIEVQVPEDQAQAARQLLQCCQASPSE
jgi:hypothetical protein